MSPQRRSKHHPALLGDRVRLRTELIGKTEEAGVPYRAQPGIEGEVIEVREDGDLILRVGRNRGICLAAPTDVERIG